MQKPQKLEIEAIKTPIITEETSLLDLLRKVLKNHAPMEEAILVITSKILALTQGRVVKIKSEIDFVNIVQKESDQILGGEMVTLTLKNKILIPWAGIDRSNIEKGSVILWPENPFKEAAKICLQLKKHFKIKKLGIIISDSTCAPLRKGVHSIALGYAGFRGVNDLRGQKDLFGNVLKVTQQAVADNLATAAGIVMGEAAESTPLALINGAKVQWITGKIDPSEPVMEKEKCLFAPAFRFD